MSACFTGAGWAGVRADVEIRQGVNSFYYFEARRATSSGSAMGISGTAPTTPPTNDGFGPRADSLMVDFAGTVSASASGSILYQTVGAAAETFGFAVDFRNKYPIVYVVGPAGGNPDACPGMAANTPCVLSRQQLETTSGALSIWAYGMGYGSVGARVTINTGSSVVNRPFLYSPASVLEALRLRQFEGDRGLILQWPSAAGVAALPTFRRVGYDQVVIRQGDTKPFRTRLQVTTSAANASQVRWTNNAGGLLATGTSLNLTSTLINGLPLGQQRIIASMIDPTSGQYVELLWNIKVLASGTNTDDDGDGLSYDQEKQLALDPGNPDTDSDGLADGAEAALGFNPKVADSNGDGVKDGHQLAGNTTLPLRTLLVKGTGSGAGVVVSRTGLDAAFTSDVNPDCVQRVGIFADAVYGEPEICNKRGMRTNAGIKQGEFRYFETRRIGERRNVGHGIITGAGQIDPYCCYQGTAWPTPPNPLTPASMSINSIGGAPFLRLVSYSGSFTPYADISTNDTYGFAVDYRGTYPTVYVVLDNGIGGVSVSSPIPITNFNGVDAFPLVYGHPQVDNEAKAGVNMGMTKFRYDMTALRAALTTQGVSVTNFTPGVGIHRWK